MNSPGDAGTPHYVNIDALAKWEAGDGANCKFIPVESCDPIRKFEATVTPKREGALVGFELELLNDEAKAEGYRDKNKHLPGFGFRGVLSTLACTDDRGIAEVQVWMPMVGGARIKVTARVLLPKGEKGPVLRTEQFETWRRIYLEQVALEGGRKGRGRKDASFATPSLTNTEKLREELGRAFIELVLSNSPGTIAVPAFGKDTRIYAIDYGEPVSDAKSRANRSAREDNRQRHDAVGFRSIECFVLARSKTVTEKLICTADQTAPKSFQLAHTRWQDDAYNDPGDWLDEIRAVPLGATHDPKSLLGHTRATGPKTIEVDFRDSMGWQGAGKRVRLEIKYRAVDARAYGLQQGRCVWIASQRMHGAPMDEFDRESTLVHEVGHLLHLVPRTQPTFFDPCGDSPDALGHCNHGASRTFGGCVMFAGPGPAKFCAECLKSARISPAKRGSPWI